MRSPGTAGAALFGYATTIACTRVYTQDHTVPQIVVGAMLGAGCAIVNENLFGEKKDFISFYLFVSRPSVCWRATANLGGVDQTFGMGGGCLFVGVSLSRLGRWNAQHSELIVAVVCGFREDIITGRALPSHELSAASVASRCGADGDG